MLRTYTNSTRRRGLVRCSHSTAPVGQAFRQLKQPPKAPQIVQRGKPSSDTHYETQKVQEKKEEVQSGLMAKRNQVGVQLLSRTLHAQIFRDAVFPPPLETYVQIAKEHLTAHGLDPKQGSILPDTEFTLPQLQGRNLVEHFHHIGSQAGEPWISLAKSLVDSTIPPMPDHWDIQSGWTKYHHLPDGLSYSEHVEYPMHEGKPEDMLTFDVEAMHKIHPYAIMATAASPNGWYAWISPWLLGETDDPNQLIPLGDPTTPRVIVGHNVSYDRGRVKEEYHLDGTKNRFIDTMALHVAVKGISSNQRPAWMKHRKLKETEVVQTEEAIEAYDGLIAAIKRKEEKETNENEREALKNLRLRYEQGDTPILPGVIDPSADAVEAEAEVSSQRWEDLTSANSLADVAKLHCGIEVDKTIRDDFATRTPEEIREDITDYLTYCANDVHVTHRVFAQALPAFLKVCPHPVSFSGILTMGSSFLPVNQEWDAYIARADAVYQQMEENVKTKLKTLAEAARTLMDLPGQPEVKRWMDDPWLSQLDWTPKVVGKSRGVVPTFIDEVEAEPIAQAPSEPEPVASALTTGVDQPSWFNELSSDPLNPKMIERVIPLLLKLSYDGHPLTYTYQERWHFLVDGRVTRISSSEDQKTCQILCPRHAGIHLQSGRMKSWDMELAVDMAKLKKPEGVAERVVALAKRVLEESKTSSVVVAEDPWLSQLDWTPSVTTPTSTQTAVSPPTLKRKTKSSKPKPPKPVPVYWPKWYWDAAKPKKDMPPGTLDITVRNRIAPILMKLSWHGWPLFHSREHGWTFRVCSKTDNENGNGSGNSNVTSNGSTDAQPNTPTDLPITNRGKALSFSETADQPLIDSTLHSGFTFYKLPHKDGEKANVGSPLGKTFMKFALDGTLKSPGDEAKEALDLNAQCSYWISARDRISNQLVVWQDKDGKGKGTGKERDLGFGFVSGLAEDAVPGLSGSQPTSSSPQAALSPLASPTASSSSGSSLSDQGQNDNNREIGLHPSSQLAASSQQKWGIILPQVITMGTVTRRAIEKTWLTASNAKPNRVGSELKAMVRAPPGYSIVGADVDSEELWISSCMGDAQFGMHGATALGWMTLEGTKASGTDLHSKTANILGISRDQAKVFNYSRIYGAGMKHAVLLLLQGNPRMSPDQAKLLASNLYASTKGTNTQCMDMFDREKFWFGGSESFVFNKLEEIAVSERPQTPALGCGVTDALLKSYLPTEFGEDFMPSRINWVVQSSGVDYLHLLIVSMDHLIAKYDINARYLISVHDELRYLVKDEDRYRAALALQIANLWTRSLFAYRLGMDDLPQSVAFFSAVDVDWVLRKEVDMPCVTPSQPLPISPGESLDIHKVLEKTNGGSLRKDGMPMVDESSKEGGLTKMPPPPQGYGYADSDCLVHRAKNASFLKAQMTQLIEEIMDLAKRHHGRDFADENGKPIRRKGGSRKSKTKAALGDGEGVDWSETIDRLLHAEKEHLLH